MKVQKDGIFIVLEGGEGSGKTTQAKLLYDRLVSKGWSVFLTKEPGGDEGICKDIRTLLLNPKYAGQMDRRTELMLFEADRAQHVALVIQPELEAGRVVISDRYEGSTFAYQCGARGFSKTNFEMLNDFATDGLRPDFVFWIDIDPRLGLERNVQASKRTRFEMEDLSFHEKVRVGYEEYFKRMPEEYWQKIDGSKSIEEIHQEIVWKMAGVLASSTDL